MSDLTPKEKRRFERLLAMGSGYVLNFSNRTIQEFILDTTGRDIYDSKYDNGSGSKANRLRRFWDVEPNHVVGKLTASMLDLYVEEGGDKSALFEECNQIVQRLLRDLPVEDLDALLPNADGRDFESLAGSVRDSIEKNHPEAGLDRLHTFVVKYIRVLSEKNGISIEKDKPLHSVFGEYVKYLRTTGLVESDMAERILKSSVSILEAFNRVRNDQSLAHDNSTLSYAESVLILNNIASSIRFIRAVERELERRTNASKPTRDDLPF